MTDTSSVNSKYRPPAPTEPFVDDENNVFWFKFLENYPKIDFYEYSRDFWKTWNPVISNPIEGIERDHDIWQIRVRVKSINGSNPWEELSNPIAYTSMQEDLEQIKIEAQAVLKESIEENNKDADIIRNKYPVARLVHKIVVSALEQGASDIHIEPTNKKPNSIVRFRIDGVLRVISPFCFSSSLHKPIIANIKSEFAKGSWFDSFEKEKSQDWRAMIKKYLYEKNDHWDFKKDPAWRLIPVMDENGLPKSVEVDMRISILPTINWEKVVIRLLDSSGKIPTIEEMWFNSLDTKKVKEWITLPQWLIIVSGPTGSWKSTTLYSILNQLNSEEVCIITIENPVERKLEWVQQVQINEKRWRTFEDTLRSVLRQDPDIIMIWEIRDAVTAKTAIEAANTWHLVLSTLHMNFSTDIVERLGELWISREDIKQLWMTLIFSSWQRLARKICPHCKLKVKDLKKLKDLEDSYKKWEIPEALFKQESLQVRENLFPDSYKKDFINSLLQWNVRTFFSKSWQPMKTEELKTMLENKIENLAIHNPNGCEHCAKGYKGRTLVAEVFKPTSVEKGIITESSDWFWMKLRESSMKTWFITMKQDWFIKVLKWLTDVNEIYRVIKTSEE